MSQREVSVVVCTDGRLPFVRQSLHALAALDYRAFEVVFVVGPTPDGTREFLREGQSAFKLVECSRRNLSHARNLGIARSAGDIVAFLDDDAAPEPEWLADLNAAYDDAEGVAAGGLVYDPSGLKLQAGFVTIDRLGYPHEHWSGPARRLNFPFSPEFPHLLGTNSSFLRRRLIDLGGFDEEFEYFLDETDLIARVNDSGGGIAQCARAIVHHKFAASALRDADRTVREWRALIKNRVYFGLRNGQRHHSPLEVLGAALHDARDWERLVERNVAVGRQPQADLDRFHDEALAGMAAGVAAAREPRRKLMHAPPAPPAFRPFPVPAPPEGRLCVALVTQDYPPGQNGGIARNMSELAHVWAARGHFVHVFTRSRIVPSLDFENGVWVHRLGAEDAPPAPDLVAPHRIPQDLWAHSHAMAQAVARLDAVRPVDFVYAPLWDAEPLAFLVEPRFALVCALQTTMDMWLDSHPEKRKDRNWMRARGAPLLALENWILERAPRLHANSRALVADLAARYRAPLAPERIVFAPHGLADWAGPGAPQAASEDGRVRFLFVGRLEPRKGIDVVLQAAPVVLRRHPQARLDIVGDDSIEDGVYRRAFLGAAANADILARVSFHGRVEEEALRAHYRDCDVLLAPSRYESFGLVYLEGMIFGKAVVAGSAGGGPEVVEEGVTGLLVPPGDVEALEQAMERLAADAETRRAMGAAGRRRYESRFGAETAAETLLRGLLALKGG